MPGLTKSGSMSAAAEAILAKQRDFVRLYVDHRNDIDEVQQRAIDELVPALAAQNDDDNSNDEDDGEAGERIRSFLQDRATIFRFLRRARFDQDAALTLLETTLKWRLRTDLDMLSLSSLHPLYVSPPQHRPPLFWMGSRFVDAYSRPCGVISLQSLERTEERTLDECKEYIVASMEIVRRSIAQQRDEWQANPQPSSSDDERHKLTADSEGPLQMVIAFDLQSSSMSNLELELLPFLLDLLKNHFPAMVGAVYVLHYGWVHAGMWGLAKRILPAQALAKIFFPKQGELCNDHFTKDAVPSPFGGDYQVEIDERSNDVMRKLGRPNVRGGSAPSSPTGHSPVVGRKSGLSRSGSYESMADYFSASGTPRTTSSNSLTPRNQSGSSTPRGNLSRSAPGLQMTANAARKLRELQMTRGAGSSDGAGWGQNRSRVNSNASQSSQTSTASSSRTVRGRGDVGLPASSSLPRVRSLRDFHLDAELNASSTLRDDSSEEGDESDADSSKSGKAGETRAGAPTAGMKGGRLAGRLGNGFGLLGRWRGGRGERANGEAQPELRVDAKPQQTNGDDVEVPSSPELQVPDVSSDPPIAQSSIGSQAAQRAGEDDPSTSSPPRYVSLQRSRKYEGIPGAVSPYNSSNPFWGYPAYIVPSASTSSTNLAGLSRRRRAAAAKGKSFAVDGTGTRNRQMTVRRRWRDLFRTLSYLFVLRILAFNRQLRWELARLLATMASPVRLGVGLVLPSRGNAARQDEQAPDRRANDGGDDDDEKKWREATERHRKLRAASTVPGATVQRSAAVDQGSGSSLMFVIIFLVALYLGSRRRRQGLRETVGGLIRRSVPAAR